MNYDINAQVSDIVPLNILQKKAIIYTFSDLVSLLFLLGFAASDRKLKDGIKTQTLTMRYHHQWTKGGLL